MKLQDVSSLHWQDALTLLCGNLIGSGISRQVYTCPLNPDWVVKFQVDTERFQNQREWAVWDAVREVKRIAAWFAPCLHISDCGSWMIQRRTRPVELAWLKKHHPRVPNCFSDLKVGNWGMVGNVLTCHDYGTALTLENGLGFKTKRADWWE